MMGGETPETCSATHKHQVMNLWNCCILLVELLESLPLCLSWNNSHNCTFQSKTKTTKCPYISHTVLSHTKKFFAKAQNGQKQIRRTKTLHSAWLGKNLIYLQLTLKRVKSSSNDQMTLTAWKGCTMQKLWSNLRCHLGVWLDGQSKTTQISHNDQCPIQNWNRVPLKHTNFRFS